MNKETIIFSLGGSVVVPEEIDVKFLSRFRDLIIEILPRYKQVILVTGGGRICRVYQKAASQVTKVSNTDLDWIGIAATRYNAELVRAIFSGHAYSEVIEDPTKKVKTGKKLLIGCGWKPGCSSDKDAVLLAQTYNASQVVNLSNISYVYDKDPNKFHHAQPITKMNWKEFFGIIGDSYKPGMNTPFDPVAAKLARRLKLKVVIIKGTNLGNLRNLLDGKEFEGTEIS